MPRVYMSDADRQAAAEQRENEVFSLAIRTAKGRLLRTEDDMRLQAGISKPTYTRLKNPEHVSGASFGLVRALAHIVRLTPQEWLRLGGYD